MSKGNVFIKYWDSISIIVLAVISMLIFFFELIPEKYFYSITLTILATIAISELRENLSRDRWQKDLEKKMGAYDVRTVDQREFYILLEDAVSKARASVDLTYIEKFSPEMSAIPEKTKYFQTIKSIVRRKEHVVFRLIYAIPDDPAERIKKTEWIRSRLLAYQQCGNMNIRLIDFSTIRSPVPLLSLQIVDLSQLFVIDMRKGSHTISQRVDDLWADHPEILKHFCRYYDVLWANAIVLKEGNLIKWDLLPEIEKGPLTQ